MSERFSLESKDAEEIKHFPRRVLRANRAFGNDRYQCDWFGHRMIDCKSLAVYVSFAE
jgi:hypothetical protein